MTTMKTLIGGHTVNFETGRISKVDIRDIAHSLSMQVRFMGHVANRYSVAYHSCLVSHYMPNREDALWGLLHDAVETYTGDISRPMRALMGPGFRVLLDEFWIQIAEEFGLERPMPQSVRLADNRILAAEMKSPTVYGHEDVVPLGAETAEPYVMCFSPNIHWEDDYSLFMDRYEELTGAEHDTERPTPPTAY